MAAVPMVPDALGPEQRATRIRLGVEARAAERVIRGRLSRRELRGRAKRLEKLWREDNPRTPEVCEGAHSLRVTGYLRGARPSGMDCEKPLRVVCEWCDFLTVWRCSNHRESKCKPCAARYRRRVRSLASAGMSKDGGHYYFLTLTAPSDVHYYGRSGEVCPCSVKGFELSRWNAGHSGAWNRFRTALSQEHPELEFFRGVETQKRGALHDHVLIWVESELDEKRLRDMAIRCGFGHELYAPEIVAGSTRAAYYVSKYITKSCDSRDDIPWWGEVVDMQTGEVSEGLTPATFRTWSQSQGWGTTMSEVRAQAGVWAAKYEDDVLAPLRELLSKELSAEPYLGGLPVVSLVT